MPYLQQLFPGSQGKVEHNNITSVRVIRKAKALPVLPQCVYHPHLGRFPAVATLVQVLEHPRGRREQILLQILPVQNGNRSVETIKYLLSNSAFATRFPGDHSIKKVLK